MAILKKSFYLHVVVWALYLICLILFFYVEFSQLSWSLLVNMSLLILFFYLHYNYIIPKYLFKKLFLRYYLSVLLIMLVFNLSIALLPNKFFDDLLFKDGVSIALRFFLVTGILVFHLLVGLVIKFFRLWRKNEAIRKEIESERISSELQFLKMQLNPHFLFNSLNTVYSLSVKNSSNTSEAIITLSELMRYMLYEANQDYVLLSKELNYIKNYIKLQRLRLSNSEQVSLNIYGDDRNIKIQPLIFISFIENAFKYGTDFTGKTIVKISITINEDSIHFFVSNVMGSIKNKDKDSSGVGLENIKNRLKLLYPDTHELRLEQKNETFTVDLLLKRIKNEVYNN